MSDSRMKGFEAMINGLPDTINRSEMIALIVVIIAKYGAQDQWAELSTAVTVTLADLDSSGHTVS